MRFNSTRHRKSEVILFISGTTDEFNMELYKNNGHPNEWWLQSKSNKSAVIFLVAPVVILNKTYITVTFNINTRLVSRCFPWKWIRFVVRVLHL